MLLAISQDIVLRPSHINQVPRIMVAFIKEKLRRCKDNSGLKTYAGLKEHENLKTRNRGEMPSGQQQNPVLGEVTKNQWKKSEVLKKVHEHKITKKQRNGNQAPRSRIIPHTVWNKLSSFLLAGIISPSSSLPPACYPSSVWLFVKLQSKL